MHILHEIIAALQIWHNITSHHIRVCQSLLQYALHPGHQEANVAVSLLEAGVASQCGQRGSRLKLLPVALHAGMSAASQAAALQPTPRTHRKASLVPWISPSPKYDDDCRY